MLKLSELVKNLEIRAFSAIRDLLEEVPGIEFEQENVSQHDFDGLFGFSGPGGKHALVIAIKSKAPPRTVRLAVYQLQSCMEQLRISGDKKSSRKLIPMIVGAYLSPESRAICRGHNVAYLDLVGNTWLKFDNVYIDRATAEKPSSETRMLRSIYSPKAAAILRVLLHDPGQAWRVADLAAKANASYGHVSNVRKALLEREWLEIQDDGVVLIQPGPLLKTWRELYRRPAGESITGYTHLHGKLLDERLRGTLSPNPERARALYALHSAAQWYAPFSRSGAQTFYADEKGTDVLKNHLELKPAASGANVVLYILTDESLFDDASEPRPGIFCTSPVVTYLDLWNGNDREREAAEHLADEFFPWLK